MLTLSFVAAVFTSVLWIIYTYFYLGVQLAGNSFETLGTTDMAICMFVAFAPIVTIWFFWDRIRALHNEKSLSKQIFLLSSQIAQNQEYSEIIARILLQTSQQQNKQSILSQTNFYIAEMNEILFDILQRYEFMQVKDISNIWKNVNMGNRYGFAKAFIDLQNTSYIFQSQLRDKARTQPLLLSTMKEFCSRYTQLVSMLKKQDKENDLSSAIESGAFGKVFLIFSSVINTTESLTATGELFASQDSRINEPETSSTSFQNMSEKDAGPIKKFWQKLHKPQEEEPEEKIFPDTLSIALERSFGASNTENNSPKISQESPFNQNSPSVAKHIDSPFYTSNNNRTILSLQKEWEELNKNNFSNVSKELFANEK